MTQNDISIAKLISRGLIEPLSAEEQSQLRDYLSSSETSQKFAELSAEIQLILCGTDLAQADPFLLSLLADSKGSPPSGEGSYEEGDGYEDSEPGPGLSQLSRARIARRLADEMQAESSTSESDRSRHDRPKDDRLSGRMVAEDESKYQRDSDQQDKKPSDEGPDAEHIST